MTSDIVISREVDLRQILLSKGVIPHFMEGGPIIQYKSDTYKDSHRRQSLRRSPQDAARGDRCLQFESRISTGETNTIHKTEYKEWLVSTV
jgi:hypothetical protein